MVIFLVYVSYHLILLFTSLISILCSFSMDLSCVTNEGDERVKISRARLMIDWIDQADQITLQCETQSTDDSVTKAIAESIRAICKLRGDVELVAPGSLPNDGKVIDDIRQYE